jgi:excisionase family DNA binding protein
MTKAVLSASTANLPLLLTTEETGRILRTTRKAIYSMIERGQLPGVTRIGRRVLIRSDLLMDWLDHNRTPSPCSEPSPGAAQPRTSGRPYQAQRRDRRSAASGS